MEWAHLASPDWTLTYRPTTRLQANADMHTWKNTRQRWFLQTWLQVAKCSALIGDCGRLTFGWWVDDVWCLILQLDLDFQHISQWSHRQTLGHKNLLIQTWKEFSVVLYCDELRFCLRRTQRVRVSTLTVCFISFSVQSISTATNHHSHMKVGHQIDHSTQSLTIALNTD